jgi:beta-glucanase (GH16 family)
MISRLLSRKSAAFGAAALLALGLVTTVTPVVTAATSPDCGVTLRKADGTAWRCTFSDNFDGSALNTNRWKVITSNDADYRSRKDCFVNNPKNVAVANGSLRLTTRRTGTFTCGRGTNAYQAVGTSGMVSTMGKFFQEYGRFEMRAKWPYTTKPGLQAAFWLWPQDASGMAWPVTGELDIAEWYSQHADRAIPYLHTATGWLNPSAVTNNYCILKNPWDWHVYTLVWTAKRILIKYDGKTCLDVAGGAPFNVPVFTSLAQAFGVKKNAPTSATPMPATLQVSYVRVWK